MCVKASNFFFFLQCSHVYGDRLNARRLCDRKMSRLAKNCDVCLEGLQGPCGYDQGNLVVTGKLMGIMFLDI